MALKITPVLGVVKVLLGGELAEQYRTANNNTRWIFEVEGTPEGEDALVVQLLDLRGREFNPDLGEPFFSPQSSNFYDARPVGVERVGGRFVIRQRPTETPCKYRVMIDTMHTATR